jgi:MFS family permease
MINKFSDTAVWGLVPVAMTSQGLNVDLVGLVAGAYALIWGAGQLVTGALSDRIGSKPPIVIGLFLNAIGLVVAVTATGKPAWLTAAISSGELACAGRRVLQARAGCDRLSCVVSLADA